MRLTLAEALRVERAKLALYAFPHADLEPWLPGEDKREDEKAARLESCVRQAVSEDLTGL